MRESHRVRPQRNSRVALGTTARDIQASSSMLNHSHGLPLSGCVFLPVLTSFLTSSSVYIPSLCLFLLVSPLLFSVLSFSRFSSSSDGNGTSSTIAGRGGYLFLLHALTHTSISYLMVKGAGGIQSTNVRPFTGVVAGRITC